MDNITFEDLSEAAESFEEDPEVRSDDWILARKFVDWKNLHNLSTEDVKLRVIGFLNSWHCRLPVSDKLAERIKEAYKKSTPFLNALESETLEDINLEEKKNIDGNEYTNQEIMRKVFTIFCSIGHNFRGVAASKVLSLINPNLFVIWDTSIADAYGLRGSSDPYVRDQQYVSTFIPRMKEMANCVINSYIGEKKCSRKEAIEAINNFRKYRPLAKLLDEYNWMKYYREI